MWQLTQSRSQNSNFLNVGGSNSKSNFRQFGRRLSTSISKAIRKWRSTGK